MKLLNTRSTHSLALLRYGLLYSICMVTIALPKLAIAGEAYVTNSDRYSYGYSKTDLDIQSKSWLEGTRKYVSVADKIYLDGDLEILKKKDYGHDDFDQWSHKDFEGRNREGSFGQPVSLSYDEFTVHTASSYEFGKETFGEKSKVEGTTKSVEYFKEHGHTSAAGVR